MTQTTEQTMKQVFEAIQSGLILSKEKEHKEEVARLLEKHGKQLLDPESFNVLVDSPHESMTETLIRAMIHAENVAKDRGMPEKTVYRLIDFYQNYHFVDSHLDRIMEQAEGLGCSSDKTRFVLREYKEYLIEETLPEWTNRGKYSVPRFGQPEQWFELVDSLLSFVYGHTDHFLSAHKTLKQQLSAEKNTFLAKRQAHFESHKHYSGKGKHPDNEVFIFKDEAHELAIHLSPLMRHGYMCTRIATGERLEYKDDKPDWVTNLMKWI